MEHMKRNNLFSERQYGFISGRSTVLQLLKVIDDWSEAMDKGEMVDVIYMDFQKAFDTVTHTRLLSKLRGYGITGKIYKWIESFLTDRLQRVVVNGEFSDWSSVLSGIPQGSVLGPVLFVIFINDLPECVSSRIFLFADDTKLYRRIENDEDHDKLQKDLDSLQDWSDKWLLRFHPDKCKSMQVRSISKSPTERKYNMRKNENTIHLNIVPQEKDLGVITDEHLMFEKHMMEKVGKANMMMGLIRRSFSYLSIQSFRWLYKALVRPHLEYAQSVWSPQRKKYILLIENVQRRATKLVPGLKDVSYPDRLKLLDIPTLAYRRLRGDMIELYKLMSGLYDKDAMLVLTEADGKTTRGHSKKIFKERCRTKKRLTQFKLRTVEPWNSLPDQVVEAPSLKAFESRLDKFWANQSLRFHFDTSIAINHLSPTAS